ncbi:MAG: hypothetical protein JOZ07_16320 [Solirubrobacterales bacterium]|nr:hypothetical protein [Solirubrobacterales bacterium]
MNDDARTHRHDGRSHRHDGRSRLRAELGGDLPAGVAELRDAELSDLAHAIGEARARQGEALARAGDRALDRLPRVLRAVVRRTAR